MERASEDDVALPYPEAWKAAPAIGADRLAGGERPSAEAAPSAAGQRGRDMVPVGGRAARVGAGRTVGRAQPETPVVPRVARVPATAGGATEGMAGVARAASAGGVGSPRSIGRADRRKGFRVIAPSVDPRWSVAGRVPPPLGDAPVETDAVPPLRR